MQSPYPEELKPIAYLVRHVGLCGLEAADEYADALYPAAREEWEAYKKSQEYRTGSFSNYIERRKAERVGAIHCAA